MDDAQVFEAVQFLNLEDMLTSLYPGVAVDLDDQARGFAEDLLRNAAVHAALARRLEDDGLPLRPPTPTLATLTILVSKGPNSSIGSQFMLITRSKVCSPMVS